MRVEVDKEKVVLLVESRKRKKVVHLALVVTAFGVPKKGIDLTLVEYPQTSCGVASVDLKTTIQGRSGVKMKVEMTEAGEVPEMEEVPEIDPEIDTEMTEEEQDPHLVIGTLQLTATDRAEQNPHL